jgi:Glycosyltransferase family 87
MKKSKVRVFAAACIVLAGFCFLAALLFFVLNNKIAANKDFIAYWTAGHQLAQGANPYDFAAVGGLERTLGGSVLTVMRNPPDAFFLVLPLALFSPKIGLLLWMLALFAALSLSLWILWLLNGRPDNRVHLLGYLFAPALICLLAGQIGIFLLLGVVLFLYLLRKRPFLAGAALLLCALKPHLFVSFFAVLLVWAVTCKAYRMLAGFSAALLASCALAFWLDAYAWSQYFLMMLHGGALDEPVPALSVAFRFLIDRHAVWLQFIPETLACIWALWYFWTRRNRWSWMDHGLLVLLVSVMCAPYCWITDEAVLLPAIVTGLYWAVKSRRLVLLLGLVAGIALIEFFAANVEITTLYYLWTTPAWLAWFLIARASNGKQAMHPPAVPA